MRQLLTLRSFFLFSFLAVVCFGAGCGDAVPAGVLPPVEAPPTDETQPIPDGDDDELIWTAQQVPSSQLEAPSTAPDVGTHASPSTNLLGGDMTCFGDHLPSTEEANVWRLEGVTVNFGSTIIVPAVTVAVFDQDGQWVAEVISDDRGEFSIEVDSRDLFGGTVELSRPGYRTVGYNSSHPALSYDGFATLEIISELDVPMLEMAAGVELELERGFLRGIIVDCAGEDVVANAIVTLESNETIDVQYASTSLSLQDEADTTGDLSQFYAFNLEPGLYTITVEGLIEAGEKLEILNRVTVEILPSSLTSVSIYPE